MPSRTLGAALLSGLLLGAWGGAGAQGGAVAVAVAGMLGNKALLVVDGGEPKAVAPGESWRGVKVVSTQGNSAVLEIAGQRQTRRVGEAPVSVGLQAEQGTGRRIVLPATSDGHFVAQGLVNSRPTQFLIDTGATAIGLSASEADRMGINYKDGAPVQVATANGTARGWRIRLASVRLNDVEVRDVDAVVTPFAMPFVLLGNSYLARFQMTRNNEQMVLEKRP